MSGFRKLADTFVFEGTAAGPKGKATSGGSAASARLEGVDRMIDQLRDVGRSLRTAGAVPSDLMTLYRQVSRAAYSFRADQGAFLAAAIAAEPIVRAIVEDRASTAAAAETGLLSSVVPLVPGAAASVLPQSIVQSVAEGMAPVAPLVGVPPSFTEIRDVLLSSASHIAGMMASAEAGTLQPPAKTGSEGAGSGGARSVTPPAPAETAATDGSAEAGVPFPGTAPATGDRDHARPGTTVPDVILPTAPAATEPAAAAPAATETASAAPAATAPPAPPPAAVPQARMSAVFSLDEAHGQTGSHRVDSVTARLLTVTDGTLDQVRLKLGTDGVPSGLKALDGSDILLHQVSGQHIEGRLADGTVVLTLRIAQDGRMTVDLDAPVLHGPPGGATDQILRLDADILTLEVDLRSSDGSLHQSRFDLGPVIEIRDGSPLQTSHPGGPELAAGSDGGAIVLDEAGAPEGFTYTRDAHGDLIILQRQDNQDVAVRKVALVGDQWVVTTLAPVHFADNAGLRDIALPIRYSLTDGDGDRVESHFSLHMADSQPDITLGTMALAERFGTQTVRSGLAFTATDGVAGAAWDPGMTAPQGFRAVPDASDPTGATLRLEQSQNGSWVTVLTLVLDPATGTVSATQNGRLIEDGSNGGHTLFGLDFTVTDRDGDAAQGHLDLDVTRLGITFRTAALGVTETGVTGHAELTAFTATHGPQAGEWLISGAPQGFQYVLDGADATNRTLLVQQNGQTVARLVLDIATGKVALDHAASLLHATGNGANDQAFTLTYRLHDADGTHADQTVSLTFTDSVPVVTPVVRTVTESATVETYGGALFSAIDGVADIRWLTAHAPAGMTYLLDPADASGRTLLIQQGGVTRMTATFDRATGEYVVKTLAAFDHGGLSSLHFDLGYQVTDNDGDTVNGQISLDVTDSLPVLTNRTIALTERFGGQTVQSDPAFRAIDGIVGAAWDPAMTAPQGFRTVRDTNDPTRGTLLLQQSQNGSWVTVLTLVLDPATGRIQATQNATLLEDGSNGGHTLFSLDFTVTDRDGDAARGHVDLDVTRLGITFRTAAFGVTETGVTGHAEVTAFTATHGPQAGEWLISGAPQGFQYVLDGADATNRTLLVQQNGQTVARLVLDIATGKVALDHAASLLHATGNGANDQAFTLTYRLHDADGSHADRTVSLTFTDSVPVVTPVTEQLSDSSTPQTVTGALFSAVDGVASARWSTANAPAGFTYVLDPADVSGRTLLIQQGGVTRLTASLNLATGQYSLTQNSAINHGGQPMIGFNLSYQVTDRDGDAVTGGLRVEVSDTGAMVQTTPMTLQESLTPRTIDLAQIVADDGVASVTWTGITAGSGFTSSVSGNNLLIRQMQAGTLVTVMTLGYNAATGKITATQNAPIDHLGDGTTESFFVNLTVTDRDGSTTPAGVRISVQDSQPGAPTITFAPASMTDGQSYNGTWANQRTGDRIVALDITLGGQTQTVDLTNPNSLADLTVNGVRVIWRANGSFTLSSNVTQDQTMVLQVGARDADGDVAVSTLTRQVDFVNIAPTGTSNTILLPNRNNYTLQLADLGFADRDGNSLDHITVTTLANNGAKLLLNGVQLGLGSDVSVQDILAGKLVLQLPATATVGTTTTTSFTATDTGGTSHGGNDTSLDFDLTFTISNSTRLSGTAGNDVFNGDIPVDNYDGGAGDDTIRGGGGGDFLNGGDGNDSIWGDAGADTLRGGIGNDQLWGGADNDTVYGDDGNDTLYGDDGNDYLYGGAGDDILFGGTGTNNYTGGPGADTFVIDPAQLGTTNDWVKDYSFLDGDVIDLSLILDYLPTTVTDLEAGRYAYTTVAGNRILRVKSQTLGDCAVVAFPMAFVYTDEQIKVKFKDIQGNYHYDLI